MRALVILLLFQLISTVAVSQSRLPTFEILTNTYAIKTDTLRGTCFIIEEAGEEYLVTAKHLFKKSIKNNDLVFYHLDKEDLSEPFNGFIWLHENPNIDIVVIKLTSKISFVKNYETKGGFRLGQDCFFLGFPYKEKFSTKMQFGRVPLVKKATMSGSYTINDTEIFLLDGHNNPGFSGGPVIAYNHKMSKNVIIGVISGYRPQFNKAYIPTDSSAIELNYSENSGIIYSYNSQHYLEIIKLNQ